MQESFYVSLVNVSHRQKALTFVRISVETLLNNQLLNTQVWKKVKHIYQRL
jgi:uncharacterized protein YqgQ